MDKNSQKTLGNKDWRKLGPGRYLNLSKQNCILEPIELSNNFNSYWVKLVLSILYLKGGIIKT